VMLFCSSFVKVPRFVIQFLVSFLLPKRPALLRPGKPLYTQCVCVACCRRIDDNSMHCLQSISGDVCHPVCLSFDVVVSGFDYSAER